MMFYCGRTVISCYTLTDFSASQEKATEREKLTAGRTRLPSRSSPTNKTKVTSTLKRTNMMRRLRGTLGPSVSHDSLSPIFAEWEVTRRRGSINSERETGTFLVYKNE